ncbi:hypothetical protein [Desulfurivibrio alkaliphilus]|uniref:Lipoprotein n=1 Tax=Desulfurivibrio alkaliphilus (strain DSM 19089 / UNIQEM U267 / AHT2) TaxID=589865 RepID=D6Z6F4_DESAT|nr:hypothetical protein [Desulfurivibrio alkaliphilus]ADH86919.1 conserved hypothetical protein [Desulfurivibrio alkaliphilus AHT 2]
MRNNFLLLPLVLIALLLLLTVGACAPELGRQSEVLLQRDYLAMDDEELQAYYRRLGDQLVRETRAAREGGLMSRPAEQERLAQLRQRWNEVRAELARREL